ncbi:LysR family transcriptional regulator [Zavarzinia compransoris]|uniref:LysR family transcriptional regulator n=1 Tax=Zavarzinia compransoris TaxID=1264899 RepID=A0A317E2M9_9PROT|nr:LysR family transcriptional regulator [Zavarzinia compransoris]PWR20852.1 LysR family transcriptional regulator [Zavarzinia compransoris]TDP44312.1 LysR family transcriptional regulator [Zavarzinia compransoris]
MNVDNIDLRLLRVFHALAEHGGFAGAQAELGLTPSTLSIHLSNLEQRLGMVLCERGRGGFRLTDKGERVHLATKRLFTALEGFRAETASLRGKLVGELTIGLVDSTVTDQRSPIAAAIRRFEGRDNDVHLRLIVDRPAGLNHALLDGRLNLAVGIFPRHVAGVEYETLYTERSLLYCGAGHEFFGKPGAGIDALAISRARFVGRAYNLERDFNAIGRVLHKASVENMEAQAHLILSGSFIGFLPEHYARGFAEAGRMQAIAPERFELTSEVALATPGVGKPNMVVRTFCDDLRQVNAALAVC